MRTFKEYYLSAVIAAVVITALAGVTMGAAAMLVVIILGILEWSLSFDNAVVNAKILNKLNPHWQHLFLTVGMLIAVGGMRFLFPLLVVVVTAGLSFSEVINLALHHPHAYAAHLSTAHGQIAVLGGIYLLMIFLDWAFEEREPTWLPFERTLAKAGKLDSFAVIIALGAIAVIASTAAHGDQFKLAIAGVASLLLYKVVSLIGNIFDDGDDDSAAANYIRTGHAALGLFIYLEVQDAVFSFDGVSGAFAVTDKVILIAAGLGIGALFVRSMTIHFVQTDKLAEFRFLDHGAHWAIGILAVCLLVETTVPISNYITGFIGAACVISAAWHSHVLNKRDERNGTQTPSEPSPLGATTLPGAAGSRSE